MKYLKKKTHMALWKVVVTDILMVGVILVIFAFFHHALPAMITQWQRQNGTQQQTIQTVPTEASQLPAETELAEKEPTQSAVATEATQPDNRTPWQIKFEDHFTEEVVLTENSYSSPDVSITVETVSTTIGSKQVVYYVADIYIAGMANFTTRTAHGTMLYFDTQEVVQMSTEANAILAISGDFLTYQKDGFLLRNGEVYTANHNGFSICALFPDGTMETYEPKTYTVADILAREPLQVWSFGPVLLDENGCAKDSYQMSTAVSYTNPRSAIGYYEPGHYCFVVVDGRQAGHSDGMTMPELAAVFEELGCVCAYNLDGGGSATMVFDGAVHSSRSNGQRALGDILVITDPVYWTQAVGQEQEGQ